MTKQQYLKWLKTRPADPAEWDHKDCAEADALIRRETLRTFEAKVRHLPIPAVLKEWLVCSTGAHFGSVEVDDVLTNLDCYPKWMERRS